MIGTDLWIVPPFATYTDVALLCEEWGKICQEVRGLGAADPELADRVAVSFIKCILDVCGRETRPAYEGRLQPAGTETWAHHAARIAERVGSGVPPGKLPDRLQALAVWARVWRVFAAPELGLSEAAAAAILTRADGRPLDEAERRRHGLALGEDPHGWCARHRVVFQPLEERLFDLLWELTLVERQLVSPSAARIAFVRAEARRLGRELFGGGPRVSVSLNSDDPISFATRLADEYAYAYHALVRQGATPDEAVGWLDRVREMGWLSRITDVSSVDPALIGRLARVPRRWNTEDA